MSFSLYVRTLLCSGTLYCPRAHYIALICILLYFSLKIKYKFINTPYSLNTPPNRLLCQIPFDIQLLTQLVSLLSVWLFEYKSTKFIYCLPTSGNSLLKISWTFQLSQFFLWDYTRSITSINQFNQTPQLHHMCMVNPSIDFSNSIFRTKCTGYVNPSFI